MFFKRKSLCVLAAEAFLTSNLVSGRLGLGSVAPLEFFDTTGCIDNFLFARVERMRLRRGLDLDQRVVFAIRPFKSLATLGFDAGARQERKIATRIQKDDICVFGVASGFHSESFLCRGEPKDLGRGYLKN